MNEDVVTECWLQIIFNSACTLQVWLLQKLSSTTRRVPALIDAADIDGSTTLHCALDGHDDCKPHL